MARETPSSARNWWRVAFFVLLLCFEVAREWAVIATYEPAKISTTAHVGRVGTYVSATGRWKRLDDGSPLVAGAVRIACYQTQARCDEVSYSIVDGYAGTPDVSSFDAKFSEGEVAYENDEPACARYVVRIDVRLEKVLAVRERKDAPDNPVCKGLEPRIEMTLADGFEQYRPDREHVLPIASLARAVFGS